VQGFIFCNLKLKKGWHGPGIELATLDISSQSGAFDLSARAAKVGNEFVHAYRKVGMMLPVSHP